RYVFEHNHARGGNAAVCVGVGSRQSPGPVPATLLDSLREFRLPVLQYHECEIDRRGRRPRLVVRASGAEALEFTAHDPRLLSPKHGVVTMRYYEDMLSAAVYHCSVVAVGTRWRVKTCQLVEIS
ncbi:MAG: hypothetical protein GTO22_20770, partial [Gemmatimonadales bacterium]|nr:hypothetical protein [Gemmatimonadales bacterium]